MRVLDPGIPDCSRPGPLVALAALLILVPADAGAQLDPLLFLKRAQPNVLLVIETTNRMQRDASEDYYDPQTYPVLGEAYEAGLGITSQTASAGYRRRYVGLVHTDVSISGDRFEAGTIVGVGDLQAGFATFDARTRLSVARIALAQAVQANRPVARFGLIRTRQANPRLGALRNEGPVRTLDAALATPTETGQVAKWLISRPEVDAANGSIATVTTPLVRPDAPGASAAILATLAKRPDESGALIPAGRDAKNIVDAPLEYLLDDARAEASRLIAGDTACRNTIVVLVVGGGEGTTAASQNPAGKASQFLNISGRRVPIYVVAIAPAPAAVPQLQAVAANSGGRYVEITKAAIEAAPPGSPVPELVAAVNTAVQHALVEPSTFNAPPSPESPTGPPGEFQVTSPIVGTVDLANARDIGGNELPNSVIRTPLGTVIPQRSNVMVTSGFALPGFVARLRAFRMYRPEPDASKPSGYRFVADGTRLWVATTPAPADRNIYTVLPDGRIVAFTTASAPLLAPYLKTAHAAALIEFVRAQPLGAIVSSTPAFLDPPSLDPPPDPDYPAFADAHKRRRGLIFVGANDGMLHAIDARRGVEVWAMVPFNLLPKLKALVDGQAPGSFDYFVDASPKLADVKVGGAWRTYLVVGEGAGGTFYQCFDVTLVGIGSAVAPDDDDVAKVLAWFKNPDSIPFVWSFPRYASFDPDLAPYGDVGAGATSVEKTVGQSWSDPAVGQVYSAAGRHALLVGSGFLPSAVQRQPHRGGTIAGTTFYLIDVANGQVLDSRDVGSDGLAEQVDDCAAAGNCSRLKNALQSDPVATGPADSRFMTTAYIGDLDGRVWRFALALDESHRPVFAGPPGRLYEAGSSQPIFASMATVNVGGTEQYLFFGTGSDLLPSTGVSQAYRLLGILDQGGTGIKKLDLPLSTVDGSEDDEKVTAFPAVAGDIVFFSTTVFRPATPCAAPDANVYALTFIGGPAYDNTGDGTITRKDTPKVRTIAGARATAPFVVDQHLVVGAGGKVEVFGDAQDFNNGVGQVGVRILSWREAR